eukprot:CAMPEP_0119400428 /NCGR_PEP_ID=MMETSP1334-20130426/141864_1 /TAXON_ID=127549 /ORGANISM="Calcidiscus leptoporus, Strain RCC1130" /LENGTH=102 /DNA_ID=CAMNT_0007424337 /DNA_START=1858 /DNA_END=2166 /DNA_ORIENTATION=+
MPCGHAHQPLKHVQRAQPLELRVGGQVELAEVRVEHHVVHREGDAQRVEAQSREQRDVLLHRPLPESVNDCATALRPKPRDALDGKFAGTSKQTSVRGVERD